jgi:hypothetical protein
VLRFAEVSETEIDRRAANGGTDVRVWERLSDVEALRRKPDSSRTELPASERSPAIDET